MTMFYNNSIFAALSEATLEDDRMLPILKEYLVESHAW